MIIIYLVLSQASEPGDTSQKKYETEYEEQRGERLKWVKMAEISTYTVVCIGYTDKA